MQRSQLEVPRAEPFPKLHPHPHQLPPQVPPYAWPLFFSVRPLTSSFFFSYFSSCSVPNSLTSEAGPGLPWLETQVDTGGRRDEDLLLSPLQGFTRTVTVLALPNIYSPRFHTTHSHFHSSVPEVRSSALLVSGITVSHCSLNPMHPCLCNEPCPSQQTILPGP